MIPRLRMLAGPNGSGKSTLAQQLIDDYAVNLYKFLNADMLFAEIAQSGVTACPFSIDNKELIDFVIRSTYPEQCKEPFLKQEIYIDDNDYFIFSKQSVNSYTVAMAADFFKDQYLKRKLSFSFETVFSHPAKIDILKKAQASGFRTYMYFVATEDPQVNLNRIKVRVKFGGHDVPEDKTVARYYRCLKQIKFALPYLNRAYFFDNSSTKTLYFAEYELSKGFQLHSEMIPDWFNKFVLS